MPMTRTRRRFMAMLPVAGAAGFVRVPLAPAAEGALNRPGYAGGYFV
jgi:hypothetical protein